MRIVLDAMGGDNAPEATVAGAVEAARAFGVEVVLVGPRDKIQVALAGHDTTGLALPIVHAAETISMDEHPAMAVRRKKDSSIAVAARLVRDGQGDAFISAGHSGAVMAAATLILGRLPGIARPALATVFPRQQGFFLLTDGGANTDCRPEYLLQFATMGSLYAEKVLGVNRPRVGLLSNGEEETKGDRLVQETHALLRQANGLRFVGNVEPKEMMAGVADVVVADGFVGNIVVKSSEAVAEMLLGTIREELTRSLLTRLPAALLRPAFARVRARMDYREYGGAPLLGLRGIVIFAHGRSDARAIRNAIRVAREAVVQGYVVALSQALAGSQPTAAPEPV